MLDLEVRVIRDHVRSELRHLVLRVWEFESDLMGLGTYNEIFKLKRS